MFSLVFPKHTYKHYHFLRCLKPFNYHLWRLKKKLKFFMTTLELDLFIGLFKWVPPSTTSMPLFAKSFVHLFLFISAPFTHSFTSFLDLPFCKLLSLHLYNVLFSHWNFFITPLSSSFSCCFCDFFCFLLSQQTHKLCKSPCKGLEKHISVVIHAIIVFKIFIPRNKWGNYK